MRNHAEIHRARGRREDCEVRTFRRVLDVPEDERGATEKLFMTVAAFFLEAVFQGNDERRENVARFRQLFRRHRASKLQGSSSNGHCPFRYPHGQINARRSFSHSRLVRSGHVESTVPAYYNNT